MSVDGGDPACWLEDVCPLCGAIDKDATVCPRCGSTFLVFNAPRTVRVGEFEFDVWDAGPADGDPVVLLHGFPETAESWSRVSSTLTAAGLRTIALNQRGYSSGARPEGAAAYAIDRLTDDVIGLLDELGIESAHIVGHDWGAAVAWVLAATYPGRVRTLTAVSVPHLAAYGWALREDIDQKQRASYIDLFRQPGKAEEVLLENGAERLRALFGDSVPPNLVNEHVETMMQPGAMTAALNWYRAMSADLSELPAVKIPTTYVWSTEDTAIGRAGALRCGEFVDAPYRFVELEGISHWIPEEAAESLANAVMRQVVRSD